MCNFQVRRSFFSDVCPWCHVRNWCNGKCIVKAWLPGVRALLNSVMSSLFMKHVGSWIEFSDQIVLLQSHVKLSGFVVYGVWTYNISRYSCVLVTLIGRLLCVEIEKWLNASLVYRMLQLPQFFAAAHCPRPESPPSIIDLCWRSSRNKVYEHLSSCLVVVVAWKQNPLQRDNFPFPG